ncbi:hypothetical protein C2E23DRAFT_892174 [Lenzites betulinus]|nr:hypothetical protein C2E23DRAFT_892174 [Lenzites betulinus]
MEVSSSHASSSFISAPEVPLSDLVDRMNANLITLPEELCAASRPASPSSEARTAAWKSQIIHALQIAGGDTTHPKWGYVSRITKPACTRRGYIGVAPGVKMGDGRKVKVGKDYEWTLPETEKDWSRCEKKWMEAVESGKTNGVSNAPPQATRTSKYWPKAPEEQPDASCSRAAQVPKKTALIREKVQRWQAQVATDAEERSVSQPTDDAPQSSGAARAESKPKTTLAAGVKVQMPLGFPVMKRSSVTDGKGGSGATRRPNPPEHPSPPPAEDQIPRATSKSPSPDAALYLPAEPKRREPATIADLSDHSFFPPSFPSQLLTSTPPLKPKLRKHEPIAPCSPPPSSLQSPASAKSFDPSRPRRRELPAPSSSAPAVSPDHRPLKRARSPNSSVEHVVISPLATAPAPKKARTEPFEIAPTSSAPPCIPPSTPPPATSPTKAPVTPVSKGKGLGNAKGLPVPTTPDHQLPTLTDLLASSRRSKPRPRPPSRKHTPQSHTGAKVPRPAKAQLETASELPVVGEDDGPEPSPTKTYFSSPASGSSDSMSVVHRSPVSPLFAHNSGAFAPVFTSTPRRGADDDDPFLASKSQSQSQGQGLMRGSSGGFGMAYNSQFDVEGQVDRVSELLERDVDYNGWLRDLDDEEPLQTQSHAGSVEA